MHWGQTKTQEYELAEHLSTAHLASKEVVDVDSWLVQSIFQQYKRKKHSRSHRIRYVHPDPSFKLDLDKAKAIQVIFEEKKSMLVRCSVADAVKFGREMATAINVVSTDLVKAHERQKTIEWCSIAYGNLICNPGWGVQLKIKTSKDDDTHGFSIRATRDLVAEEMLYPLIGLLASDSTAEHSHLSELRPHLSQVQEQAETEKPRVLIGPLRFINHACNSFNAQFIPINSTLSFVVCTTKAIKSGQEVFVNYEKKVKATTARKEKKDVDGRV